MARTRTQKTVSRRIDLTYFKRPSPLRTGKKALAFVAFALAIVFVTFFSIGGDGRLHNPGKLTRAHAAWENNCTACHDGGGAGLAGSKTTGGFAKTVSDASCLSCHDGALHAKTQLDSTVTAWPVIDGVSKPDAKGHFTATNCTSCHVEHRGEMLLIGSNNANCTSCHADLPANTKGGNPAVASRALAFTAADHPPFGRSLLVDGKPFDPTVVKFNHAKHNNIAALKDNCISCHSTDDPQIVLNDPAPGVAPPYKTDKDRPADWIKGSSRAEIQPVSFARHCVGCHSIEIPGAVRLDVAHRDLAELRGSFSGLGARYAAELAAMSPAEREKQLVTEVVTGRPPRQRRERKVLTEQEWVAARLAELQTNIDKSFGSGNAKYNALKRALPAPSTQPSGPVAPDPSVVEHFVTYGIGSNCNYCHEIQGDVPLLAMASRTATTTTTAPATTAAAQPRLAFTTPTGIPDSPRKWFKAAKFDHYAHRSNSCLDCHSSAVKSSLTSDFNSPGIDTGAMQGTACISCHSPDATFSLSKAAHRSAGSDCITCHQFHDRTLERPQGMSLDARTGKKVPPIPPDSFGPRPATPATRPIADAK